MDLSTSYHTHIGTQCEPTRLPQCNLMAWNSTSFPNVLQHQTQDEAIEHWQQVSIERLPNSTDSS